MDISIEYCGTCNYRPLAAALAMAITARTGVKPALVHSKEIGTFEVIADGELIFSKKKTGQFPDHATIAEMLVQRQGGQ